MNETFNGMLIKVLAKKHKISTRYVRYCLNGERTSSFSEKLKMDYKKYRQELENILNCDKPKSKS